MGEWILILWSINCGGWNCEKQDQREITGYETKAECEESLNGWKKARPANQITNNGVCIKIPVTDSGETYVE